MIRIVVISDTHNQHDRIHLPEAEILIHCGDATIRGNAEETIRFGQWLREQSSKFGQVFFVPGNHDFIFQNFPDVAKEYISLLPNIKILDGTERFNYNEIEIFGTPWMPEFNGWAFMETEDQLAKRYACIPDETEILITHGPPHSILDKNDRGLNCGSVTLYQKIKQLKKLKLHVFGHIHEGAGVEVIDDVIFANASQLNRYYELEHKPLVFDLDTKIKWVG